MRQFHPCQMCHNQWIPACSHQSPALSDVCCAGAKETAHSPAVFLSPLLLGRTFGSACLHTFGPWPSLVLKPPLSLQGSWSKGAIRGSLCLSHQRAPGSRAVVSWLLLSTSCPSTSTGRALASACRFPCSKENVVLSPCIRAPVLGKWPQRCGAHCPGVTSPATAAKATRTVCLGQPSVPRGRWCPRQADNPQ